MAMRLILFLLLVLGGLFLVLGTALFLLLLHLWFDCRCRGGGFGLRRGFLGFRGCSRNDCGRDNRIDVSVSDDLDAFRQLERRHVQRPRRCQLGQIDLDELKRAIPRMKKALAAGGMLLFALTVVVPLLWVLVGSFKSGEEIFSSPWGLPRSLKWENYSHAWQQAGISHYFVNSALVTGLTLLILLPAGAMAAYVFARYIFPGSKALFGAFLDSQFGTGPLFLLVFGLFGVLAACVTAFYEYRGRVARIARRGRAPRARTR